MDKHTLKKDLETNTSSAWKSILGFSGKGAKSWKKLYIEPLKANY